LRASNVVSDKASNVVSDKEESDSGSRGQSLAPQLFADAIVLSEKSEFKDFLGESLPRS
jgi:hypothetical protein